MLAIGAASRSIKKFANLLLTRHFDVYEGQSDSSENCWIDFHQQSCKPRKLERLQAAQSTVIMTVMMI